MLIKDPRERFGGTTEVYRRWRPEYPAALLDWVLATAGAGPGARVADVGCGTGIATRQLAARGLDVVGIEPNEAMAAAARAAGGPEIRRGEAAATGLAEESVDLVTAASAFHWFDLEPAFDEFARILKPGGRCAAFWSPRASTPFMDAYAELVESFRDVRESLPEADGRVPRIRRAPRTRDAREASFPSHQLLDREGLRGRAYSSSRVALGVVRRREFEAALDALFDRHAENGTVRFDYLCPAIVWRIA